MSDVEMCGINEFSNARKGRRQMPVLNEGQIQEARMRITREALKLIRERGYSDVSVEDITKACGISKGSFYTYFSSKDNLFNEGTFVTYRAHILEEYEKARDLPLLERLAYFEERTWSVIENWRASTGREWIRFNMQSPDEQGIDALSNGFERNIDMVEQLLRDAVTAGELRPNTPARVLAESIVASRIGFEALYCSRDGDETLVIPSSKRFDYAIRPILEPFLTNGK